MRPDAELRHGSRPGRERRGARFALAALLWACAVVSGTPVAAAADPAIPPVGAEGPAVPAGAAAAASAVDPAAAASSVNPAAAASSVNPAAAPGVGSSGAGRTAGASDADPAAVPHEPRAALDADLPVQRGVDQVDQLEQLILTELPRVVTAAAFREQTPEEAPSAVVIVTADDLRASGARTLGEALERCAGIDLSPGDHLAIRGLGQVNRVGGTGDASRILLLIDGVRVNDVFADSFTVGVARGVEDIARIEVVKGPGSALYGTSAFAGVVQVVTFRGADQEGAEGRARVEGMASDTLEARAGGVAGAWEGSIYGRAQVSGDSFVNPQRALELHGTTAWKGLSLTAGYSRLAIPPPPPPPDAETGGTPQSPPPGGAPALTGSSQQEGYAALQWEGAFSSRVYALARASVNGRTMDVPARGVDEREGRLAGEGRLRWRVTPRLWTTGGLEVRTEAASTPIGADVADLLTTSRQVAAAYAQAEVGPFFSTTLTAGVRAERIAPASDRGTARLFQALSPRAGLVTSLPSRTVLKAFFGQAYQAPSLSMLFYDTRVEATTILANPTLRPERMQSLELEASQPLPFGLLARVNLFQDDIRDLIAPDFVDPVNQPDLLQFVNRYDAQVRGGELELTWSPRLPMQAFGNVTLLDARNLVDRMPLPLVPRVRWNAGLRGSPLPGTWGWLSVTYTGKRTGVEGDPLSPDVSLESRLRIDARLAVDLGRRWQVALNVRNLLDSQSTDFLETRVLTGTGTEAWLELTFRPPRTGRASRTGEVP